MSFKGIYFKGRGIVRPGVYASVNADAMVPNRLSPANTIGAVGICAGGQPNTALRVSSLSEAVKLLRSGDLETAAELMYDPSPDMPGAGDVVFVRVSSSTTPVAQSTHNIGTQINQSSRDYGNHTNFIRCKMEDGSAAAPYKKFTVQHQMDDVQEVLDNFGQLFTIHYIGSSAHARLTIDPVTAKTALVEVSADGTTWTTLISVPLDTDPNNVLGNLITTLNACPDLSCTADKYVDQTMTSLLMDPVSQEDILTSPYVHLSSVGPLLYWENNISQLISGTAGSAPSGNMSNFGWTYFTGGSDGAAPSNNDWATAISVLENESDVAIVYLASPTEAVHLEGAAHVDAMCDITEGKERRLVVGGALNESVDAVTTRAIDLSDKNVMLAYPGIKRVNLSTGNLDTLAPYFLAACYAGMTGGSGPEIPLTNKTLKVQGLEKTLTNTDIVTLLNGGVAPAVFDRDDSVYRCVQSLTTYLTDANVIYRKWSGMGIKYYLQQQARNVAKPYVGQVASTLTMTNIKMAVASLLQALTVTAANPDGILTDGIVNGVVMPSYTNLVVNFDGFDWVSISFDALPVGEIAYITIDASFKPAQIQV